MPGEDLPGDHSRASAVISRVLALDSAEVAAALADVHARFADRPALDAVFRHHFDTVAHRLGGHAMPAPDYQLLIGAYFTHDVSPEGAALTNPSIVAHPDQTGVEPGGLRFVMSARAIGEGHVSSVEFRTGLVTAAGLVHIDAPGRGLGTPELRTAVHQQSAFWARLTELGSAGKQRSSSSTSSAIRSTVRHWSRRSAASTPGSSPVRQRAKP